MYFDEDKREWIIDTMEVEQTLENTSDSVPNEKKESKMNYTTAYL